MASRPGDPSRVTLRLITAADQDEFLGLAAASAALHHPWMTLAATPQEFQDYLRRFDHVTAEGFLVCTRAIAGVATSPASSAGASRTVPPYAAFAPAAGHGYMSEGLAGAALRVRAAAPASPGRPDPARHSTSLRLVRRLGFRNEGYSPELLFIDGAWRDHERWAITSDMIGIVPTDPHPSLPGR